jgi:hypothetical protein
VYCYVCKCVLLPPGVNPIAVKYIIIIIVFCTSSYSDEKKQNMPPFYGLQMVNVLFTFYMITLSSRNAAVDLPV